VTNSRREIYCNKCDEYKRTAYYKCPICEDDEDDYKMCVECAKDEEDGGSSAPVWATNGKLLCCMAKDKIRVFSLETGHRVEQIHGNYEQDLPSMYNPLTNTFYNFNGK
jgi:hypothetical protein